MEAFLEGLSILDGINILYILGLGIIVNVILDRVKSFYNINSHYLPILNLILSILLILLTIDYSLGLKLILLNIILVTTISTYGYDLVHQLLKIYKKDKELKKVEEIQKVEEIKKDGDDINV